jgi:hypothetical protein
VALGRGGEDALGGIGETVRSELLQEIGATFERHLDPWWRIGRRIIATPTRDQGIQVWRCEGRRDAKGLCGRRRKGARESIRVAGVSVG